MGCGGDGMLLTRIFIRTITVEEATRRRERRVFLSSFLRRCAQEMAPSSSDVLVSVHRSSQLPRLEFVVNDASAPHVGLYPVALRVAPSKFGN